MYTLIFDFLLILCVQNCLDLDCKIMPDPKKYVHISFSGPHLKPPFEIRVDED